MAGMPRSGSTLLCSILNQHPQIYASSTSPLATVMWNAQETILNSPEYQAYQEPMCLENSVTSILYNYYNFQNKPHVVDKNRMWGTPENINLMLKYSINKPKVICTVRPTLEVLSSYINLIKKYEKEHSQQFIETKGINEKYESICDYLMSYDGEIYNSIWSIQNIINNKNIDSIVIPYSYLVSETKKSIDSIVKFLGASPHEFNFNNIQNINEGYALSTDIKYHQIRPQIDLISPEINDILSDRIIKKYKNHNTQILEINEIERFIRV